MSVIHVNATNILFVNALLITAVSSTRHCIGSREGRMAKVGEGDERWIVEERKDGVNVNGWHWQELDCLSWAKVCFCTSIRRERSECVRLSVCLCVSLCVCMCVYM